MYKSRHGFFSVFFRFTLSLIRLWRSKVNLKALKDRPAVSAFPQRVLMDPNRERMSLFGHDANMGRRRKERQRKIGLPYSNWPTTSRWGSCQDLGREVSQLGSGRFGELLDPRALVAR
jgi:hypothetical protein